MSIFKKYEELISQRKKMEGDIDYERDPVILETIELMTKKMLRRQLPFWTRIVRKNSLSG